MVVWKSLQGCQGALLYAFASLRYAVDRYGSLLAIPLHSETLENVLYFIHQLLIENSCSVFCPSYAEVV